MSTTTRSTAARPASSGGVGQPLRVDSPALRSAVLHGLTHSRVVRTPALIDIEQAARFVVPRAETLLVHGPQGTGKNVAVEAYLAGQPLPVTRLLLPPGQSSKDIARWLYHELIGVDQLPERSLQDDLTRILAPQQRIVVVRHVERLTKEAAHQLAYLHEQPNRRWTLLLIGGPGTKSAMGRGSALAAHASLDVHVPPLKADQLLQVVRGMHDLLQAADTDLLARIDATACHGVLQSWARFLQLAVHLRDTAIQRGQPAPVLNSKLAKAVLASMPQISKQLQRSGR